MTLRWLVCGLLFGVPVARAADWRPCRPHEPAYLKADRELQAIDEEMARLAPGADAKDLYRRISRLSHSRCLRPVESCACGTPSAVALQTYWRDGGAAHFRSYLDLGQPGKRVVTEPPSLRATLGYEKIPPEHPLHFLVCPPSDLRCGADTAAWGQPTTQAGPEFAEPLAVKDCERRARRAAPRRRFERWRACLSNLQRSSEEFPLGRLRLPDHGWLIVLGPEGDWLPEQVRAYDLSTGAMIGVAGCSGFGSRPNDGCRTVGRFKMRLQLGHAAAARESAWRLLMAETMESVQLRGISAELPPGIAPTLPAPRPAPLPDPNAGGRTFVGVASSNDSSVTWKIFADGRTLRTDELWSRHGGREDDGVALGLLEAAERSFTSGCPRTSPPPNLVDVALGVRISEIAPESRGLRYEHEMLTAGWQQTLADLRACQKRP
jgi:hypothetical protein